MDMKVVEIFLHIKKTSMSRAHPKSIKYTCQNFFFSFFFLVSAPSGSESLEEEEEEANRYISLGILRHVFQLHGIHARDR